MGLVTSTTFGDTAVDCGNDAVELWALGLPLCTFLFLSLLGWRPSFSPVKFLWNRIGNLRSLEGVDGSG